MTRVVCLAALWAAAAWGQTRLPAIDGETLSGKTVSLNTASDGRPFLAIIGFTHGSQKQTKEWSMRVRGQYPAWSVAVLEDVPRLVRGMAAHGIKSGTPKDQYDHFVLVYKGEKQLKDAVGFDRPDDAYLVVADAAGEIRWKYHGPVNEAAVEELARQFGK